MAAARVKVLPWYYTERREPTRAAELAEAFAYELRADAPVSAVITPFASRGRMDGAAARRGRRA
jgi:hypothetical protein